MPGTKAGQAENGFDATMSEGSDAVSGWKNKSQTTLANITLANITLANITLANITPAGMLAVQHREMAAPGTADSRAFLAIGLGEQRDPRHEAGVVFRRQQGRGIRDRVQKRDQPGFVLFGKIPEHI